MSGIRCQSASSYLTRFRRARRLLSACSARSEKRSSNLAEHIKGRGIRLIVVAARGSSAHAGLVAKYVWESALGIPVTQAAPSLTTLYERRLPLRKDVLVLGFSQSGASPDVSSVLAEARKDGALTAAFTNTPGSRLTEAAEHVIHLRAGKGKSLPATKTYLAELVTVYMLAAAAAPEKVKFSVLERLPQDLARLLGMSNYIRSQVDGYRSIRQAFVIGRGFNYPTAREIALKLKEMCYVQAEGYSAAEFLHGPIALVETGYPVMLIVPDGPSYPGLLDLGQQLLRRGAKLVIIANNAEVLRLADAAIEVQVTTEEIYSPLYCTLPGQLFAGHLAVAKGLDPDHPRGLLKVMETL